MVDLAAVTKRPQDVVGLHFFNPAPVMKLVEVVHTVATADDVVATAVEVCRRLGKHPVTCGDRAGFIVNALLFPYLNDAVRMLEANYATADDIDTAMKTGCGYPMGPFELLDVVGLDVSLAIQRTLYLEFREPGFAPAPRLEHLVTAGYLGRKTGRGFRTYDLTRVARRNRRAAGRRAAPARRARTRRSRSTPTATGSCAASPGASVDEDLPLPGLRPGDPAGDPARRGLAGRPHAPARTSAGTGTRACWNARGRRGAEHRARSAVRAD